MRNLASALLFAFLPGCLGVAQAPPLTFDGGRAHEHLRRVVAIGPRPAGSAAAERTRTYIRQQFAAIGLTPQEQSFVARTPLGPVNMTNLRFTIPGPAAGRLVIGGHYDTKMFRDFSFTGANDAGSSTAFLIEMGRLLKMRDNRTTIELLFLDGEESTGNWEGTDHTYGSRHYVQAARADGSIEGIGAFILVDMIADHDLRIKREARSTPWLADAIWGAATRLKRQEFEEGSVAVEDDHLNFLAAGIPAVDIIDFEYYTRSGAPAWHTRHDTLENVSARSLEIVGEVLLAALPAIEQRLAR